MIIEIALGIVLAVLILMFLDVIFAFALIGLGIAVILAISAVVLYFAVAEPIAALFVLAAAALLFGAAYLEAKRPTWTPRALWRAMGVRGKTTAAIAGALGTVAALAWITYTAPAVMGALLLVLGIGVLAAGPLLVLDWIRARRKKTTVAKI